jgi:hypothetical protein
MATVTKEQRDEVIALLEAGGLTREQIANKVGVSPLTVSAIKAHVTMGTYKGAPATDSETEELIEASETTFGLERDLQSALRANIEQLESGLRIIDEGKERTTEAGRIDITAKDAQGAVVVVELKAGTAPAEALTQLLAYMGSLASSNAGSVRGILVAGGFHPRVIFGARAVPSVQLRQYRFKFSFDSIK